MWPAYYSYCDSKSTLIHSSPYFKKVAIAFALLVQRVFSDVEKNITIGVNAALSFRYKGGKFCTLYYFSRC
jgi:hypothetical protein